MLYILLIKKYRWKQQILFFLGLFSYTKKSIEVIKKRVLNGQFVLFELVKISKVKKKQCSLMNYAFVKKNQKLPIKQKFWTKKHVVNFFCNAPNVMFLNFQKKKGFYVLFLFCFLFTKESFILSALHQKILDEIKQSNAYPQKSTCSRFFFVSFFLTKEIFCWKVSLQIIYTFYLKHHKYPFCATMFHPISETGAHVS